MTQIVLYGGSRDGVILYEPTGNRVLVTDRAHPVLLETYHRTSREDEEGRVVFEIEDTVVLR